MAERRPEGYPKLKNYKPSRFMLRHLIMTKRRLLQGVHTRTMRQESGPGHSEIIAGQTHLPIMHMNGKADMNIFGICAPLPFSSWMTSG
jgi:hypothetical protein